MWEEIVQFWKNCYNGHPFGYKRPEKKLTHEERMEERKKRREK
jgi:hypothetical protein